MRVVIGAVVHIPGPTNRFGNGQPLLSAHHGRSRLTLFRKAPIAPFRWHALWHVPLSPPYPPSSKRLHQARQSEQQGSRRCRRRLYLSRMRAGGQLRWWCTWRGHWLRTGLGQPPVNEHQQEQIDIERRETRLFELDRVLLLFFRNVAEPSPSGGDRVPRRPPPEPKRTCLSASRALTPRRPRLGPTPAPGDVPNATTSGGERLLGLTTARIGNELFLERVLLGLLLDILAGA